jgi:hypothetical protein
VCFYFIHLCLGLTSSRLAREPGHHRPLFTASNKVPGFATVAMRRESLPPPGRVFSPTTRHSDSQGEQFLCYCVEIIYMYKYMSSSSTLFLLIDVSSVLFHLLLT